MNEILRSFVAIRVTDDLSSMDASITLHFLAK